GGTAGGGEDRGGGAVGPQRGEVRGRSRHGQAVRRVRREDLQRGGVRDTRAARERLRPSRLSQRLVPAIAELRPGELHCCLIARPPARTRLIWFLEGAERAGTSSRSRKSGAESAVSRRELDGASREAGPGALGT